MRISAEFDVVRNVLHADCFFSCVLLWCVYLDLVLQIFFWNVSLRSASHAFQAQNSSSFNVLWFDFRSITVLPLLFEDTWKIHWICLFSFKISIANITVWCDSGSCGLGLRVWVLWRTFDMCLDCRLRDLGWTQSSFSLEERLSSLPTLALGLDLAKVSSSVGKWYLHKVTAERGNLELSPPGGSVGEQGMCVPGSCSPWTLAEWLMSPAFLKPEAAISPQEPRCKEQRR